MSEPMSGGKGPADEALDVEDGKDPDPGLDYQRRYYKEHAEKLAEERARRWREDDEFRTAELARARDARGRERIEKAREKYRAMIERTREEYEKQQSECKRPRRRPYGLRKVSLTGREEDLQDVYPTGFLALAVGRKTETIRDWLVAGILPGASIYVGNKAFFTAGFIAAVYNACDRIFYLDGNGRLDLLRDLVREEMLATEEPFLPLGAAQYRTVEDLTADDDEGED